MKATPIFLILAAIGMFGAPALARDVDESMLMLREAMMDSNADYNKHKKKMNHEEYDRADDWSSRDSQAIFIDGKRTVDLDVSEFKEVNEDATPNDREVSSHEAKTENKSEKIKD